jgi:DNA-binding transcriptional LysR family regulator
MWNCDISVTCRGGRGTEFHACEHALHTAQPSLSQQIRQLEAAVGVALLDQPASRRADQRRPDLPAEAKDIPGRIEHAGRLAKQAADGRSRQISRSHFTGRRCVHPAEARPLVAARLPHLRLVLHSKYAVEPVAGLLTGALDVAFLRGPIETEGLEIRELRRERIVVMLPAHHALARRKRIPVKLLHDLPCITMDRSLAPALYDAIASLYRQRAFMHAVSSADNVLGHLRLVQEGTRVRAAVGLDGSPAAAGRRREATRVRSGADRVDCRRLEIWKYVATGRAFVDLVRQCPIPRKTCHVLQAGPESLSRQQSRC